MTIFSNGTMTVHRKYATRVNRHALTVNEEKAVRTNGQRRSLLKESKTGSRTSDLFYEICQSDYRSH